MRKENKNWKKVIDRMNDNEGVNGMIIIIFVGSLDLTL